MGWTDAVKDFFGLTHNEHGYWYVYYISDPRTGKVRYVGKGSGERLFQHAAVARRLLKRGTPSALMRLSCLHKWMIELWDLGLEEEYARVYRTDDEQDAYRHEARSISHFGLAQLLNSIPGHRRYH